MIAWLDIETTGLDAKRDLPLEIGVIITDDNLEYIAERSVVIHWPEGDWLSERLDANDKFTRNMHEKSGLLSACKVSQQDRWSAEAQMVEFMRYSTDKPIMGGSSITFDRSFLAQWMPELLECFHYRSMDTSAVREMARRWMPGLSEFEPKAVGAHRVIPDLHDSIGLAAFYKRFVFERQDPTTEQEHSK